MKMSRLLVVGAVVVAGAGLMMSVLPVSAPAAVAAERASGGAYKVDPVHSTLVFRVMHAKLAPFWGRFNGLSGTFDVDDPAGASIDLSVQAESVDTANSRRDNHLRSQDFFSAKEFPAITFKSTKVTRSGDTRLEVTGDLSLHGVTRAVTAQVELTGRNDKKAGFEARFTIKRSDFGMTYGLDGGIGDEVQVFVGVEGEKH